MKNSAYDDETGLLTISDHKTSTEFQIATYEAIENMQDEFMFQGYLIDTNTAIDVVMTIIEDRTYH